MRYANAAPWALALTSAVTLAVLGAGSVGAAEDYAPASTIRFLGEGVPVAARTSVKLVACSEERPIENRAGQRPAPHESILRSPSTGEGSSTLSFRIPEAKPAFEPRSPLRQERSPGPSPLRQPSFASYVEYRGTHLERGLGRIHSQRAAPSEATSPLTTVVAAEQTILVVSHDAQASRDERTSSHVSPLSPVTSVVRVLGESPPPAKDKHFRVKRLSKPAEQQPRLQLTVGG